MYSHWHRIVALAAIVMLGWFLVSQSGGQDVQDTQIDNTLLAPDPPPKTFAAHPAAQRVPRVQWEYATMDGFDNDLANNWGNDGWELVTVYQIREGKVRSVFKRPQR
jgi:hypothetical protein